ncbi:MAG: hypothetical protein O7F73_10685 [Gammaproteobacteria bacterium]|nr:hypothetical protein [Gammaproteobacteria bacterium]
MNTIDLNYRPDTYWPESLTPEQLLSRIRGKERQDIARLAYAACGFSGLDAFLAREALTHEERAAWGRVHPLCLGGEYLPDTEAGEVEIARLSMQSTTGDQVSTRARQADGVIRYRIVGEYEDEEGMRYVLPFETREQPLSLSELMELIDGAYIPGSVYSGGILTSSWEMMYEHGYDDEELVDFISLSSPFYPKIQACYLALADEWLEMRREEDQEEEEEDCPA